MSQLRSNFLVDSLNSRESSLNMAQHLNKFLYSILGVEGKAGMISLYDTEEEIDLAQLETASKLCMAPFCSICKTFGHHWNLQASKIQFAIGRI